MKRQLPKNVRQIGNVSDHSKIYVEDYVDTFFNQLCEKTEIEMNGAFLVGEIVHEEEETYIYVYGAIKMKELELKGKEVTITEDVWKHACETCKKYFAEAEILGWFIAGGDKPLEVSPAICKTHQKYFPREQSLFVTKNARDKEENFYIYKLKTMMECSGHYIYYEKNLEMQNYMIASRKKVGFTPSEIIEDHVTKSFRSIIREKEEKNEQRGRFRMVYACSAFLVIVILVIGVNVLQNYERMKQVQQSLNEMQKEEEKVQETVGENIVNENETETEQVTQETETKEETEIQTEEPVVEEVFQEVTKEIYIVQKGDSLESISKSKYGDVSHIEEICTLNGLEDGNLIFIGQKLLLP